MQSIREAVQFVAVLEQRAADPLTSAIRVERRRQGRVLENTSRCLGRHMCRAAPHAGGDPIMTEQSALSRDAWLPDVHRSSASVVAKPRMLCVTDLGEHSKRVVTRAVVMANQLDATLAFLHVIAPEAESSAFAAACDRLERQLKSIRPLARRAPAIRLRAGDEVPTIAAVANETGADLVFLGSQRRAPLVSMVAGSARALAALVRRPVLIARRDSAAQYRSVLIAAEQSAGFDQVLRVVSSLRLLECESVAIIHGFGAPFRGSLYASGFDPRASKRNVEEWELAARRKLLRSFDATGVASDRFRLLFAQSRSIREIQREVRRVAPDLLVIATKDHAALDRVMRANAGNDALRNIECDVLLVPLPGARDQSSAITSAATPKKAPIPIVMSQSGPR